ncbi:tumor protein p53-inducible nuclear protein 2 [Engraulis encrasicolus]|uniref:tumor protein p53-inducible nuclear protein 2 n=1 Tax=Engraulis encrasicolus TaxID=184585 RepID=UPI002FD20C4F
MFQRLTNLFFGSAEELPEVPVARVHEEEDEEWQLVNITEAELANGSNSPTAVLSAQPSRPQSPEESIVGLMNSTSLVEDEVPVPVSSPGVRLVRGLASQAAGALAKVTKVTRLQQAQARATRMGRNCMQRQNNTRQRKPRHSSSSRQHTKMLQQPGHRNFCH